MIGRSRPPLRLSTTRRCAPALLLAVALALGLDPRADAGLPSTTARADELPCARYVLGPADVDERFVVVTSGNSSRLGQGWCWQLMSRAAARDPTIQPEGIVSLGSFAVLAADSSAAAKDFDGVINVLVNGEYAEVPVTPIGQRTRAWRAWGAGPYDSSRELVVFQQGVFVGVVLTSSYDAPENLDDTLALAQKMSAKAGQ